MHSEINNSASSHCFHCGHLVYDISELYDKKFNGELYCTHCDISIKNDILEVGNV